MARPFPAFHRTAVVAVCLMILVTMGILHSTNNAPSGFNWLLLPVLYLPPLLAISAAMLIRDRRTRILMLWLSAITMVLPAALGAFSGWGLLYVVGILFTLYAAWQENEGR